MTDTPTALSPGQGAAAPAALSSLDYFLIDGSGSMKSKWWECLAALDNYIEIVNGSGVSTRAIAHVFDTTNMEFIQRDGKLAEWPKNTEHPLVGHWGGTPLYDAINLMGRRLAALNPTKATIVIVTDGEETDSQYTTVQEARTILDWCRAQGWAVVFLGANFANSAQAKALGADESNAIGVRRELLAEAGSLLGRKRAAFANGADDINFSADERAHFGGYLTDRSGGGK